MNSLLRTAQLLLLISFYDFSIKLFDKKVDWGKYLVIPALVALVFLVFDVINDYYIPSSKYIFGLHITKRFIGIALEPNFSASALALLMLISLYFKRYFWALIYFSISLFSMSRNVFIMLAVLLIFYLVEKVFKERTKYLSYMLMLGMLLLPLTLGYLDKKMERSDMDFRLKISKLTSERSDLYRSYNNMLMRYPFGVGLFQGKERLKEVGKDYYFYKHLEQHNILLQVLTELGVIGIFIFIYFIYLVLRDTDGLGIVFISATLSLFIFLNGLFEPLLFISLALFGRNSIKLSNI